MKIIERTGRNGPDPPHDRNLPPFKLAISAGILIVGLIVAGLVAPTNGLRLASFAVSWGVFLWLVMISAAFAADARRQRGQDGEGGRDGRGN
jgi:membrane protein implicated in regulation of membrane protease activity